MKRRAPKPKQQETDEVKEVKLKTKRQKRSRPRSGPRAEPEELSSVRFTRAAKEALAESLLDYLSGR